MRCAGATAQSTSDGLQLGLDESLSAMSPYIDVQAARDVCTSFLEGNDASMAEATYNLLYLGKWLRSNAERPRVRS